MRARREPAPLAYLQQWTFSKYEASMYAEVIQKGAQFL